MTAHLGSRGGELGERIWVSRDLFAIQARPFGPDAIPDPPYRYRLLEKDDAGEPIDPTVHYAIVACPAVPGTTGVHTYAITERGVIYRADLGGQCPERFRVAGEPPDPWLPLR